MPNCLSLRHYCTIWGTGLFAIRLKICGFPVVPRHELFANSFLLEGEVADVLREQWQINPREVVVLVSEKPARCSRRILASLLSGPVDVDKMDYLQRDSLHCGVPYGRHFDEQRLIGSLCLNAAGDGLAVTDKGKTAAEMLIFSRYIMFSEVYWHHAVRSATAMFQRAFYLLHAALDLDALFRLPDWRNLSTVCGRPLAKVQRVSCLTDYSDLPGGCISGWHNSVFFKNDPFMNAWHDSHTDGWLRSASNLPPWRAPHWGGALLRTRCSSTRPLSSGRPSSAWKYFSPKNSGIGRWPRFPPLSNRSRLSSSTIM